MALRPMGPQSTVWMECLELDDVAINAANDLRSYEDRQLHNNKRHSHQYSIRTVVVILTSRYFYTLFFILNRL